MFCTLTMCSKLWSAVLQVFTNLQKVCSILFHFYKRSTLIVVFTDIINLKNIFTFMKKGEKEKEHLFCNKPS